MSMNVKLVSFMSRIFKLINYKSVFILFSALYSFCAFLYFWNFIVKRNKGFKTDPITSFILLLKSTSYSSCCCSSLASLSTMSFNVSCPYPIFSIILLYNKEVISRTPCSLFASASCVAATGAHTALYNFEIAFLKNEFIFYYTFSGEFPQIFWSFLAWLHIR